MTITWTTTVSRMVWRASDGPLITWAVQVAQDTGDGGDGGGGGVTDHGALTGLADNDHPQYQLVSARNQPNGYAGLDAQGTIPDIRIPSSIARDTEVTAAVAAAVGDLVGAAPGLLDTLDELAAALGDDPTFAATVTAALAGKQTASSTLTLLAALTTTSYGRALLELADAPAARTTLGLGNSATRAVGTTAGTVAAGDDSRIAGAVAASIIDAKGDLIAGTAADTAARLAVGTAGQVPIADSNATPGIRWGSLAAQNGYPAWPTRSQRFYAVPRRTTGTTAMAAGFIRLIPLVHHETVTFDRIVVFTNATVGGLARLGIYLADGTAGLPSTRLLDAGEVDTSPTAADRLITISQQLNAGQLYWLAFNCNVSTTVAHRVIDNWNEPGFGFGGINPGAQPESHAVSTQTYGAMPATLSSPSWSNAAAPYLALRAA